MYKEAPLKGPILEFIIKMLSKKFNDPQSSLFLPKLIKEQGKYEPYDAGNFDMDLGEGLTLKFSHLTVKGGSNAQVDGTPTIQDINPDQSIVRGNIKLSTVDDPRYPRPVSAGGRFTLVTEGAELSGEMNICFKNSTSNGEFKVEAQADKTLKVTATQLDYAVPKPYVSSATIDVKVDGESPAWNDVIKKKLNTEKHLGQVVEKLREVISSQDTLNSFSDMLTKAINSDF